MRPEQCGTHRLPPEDSADREAVDRFRAFLEDSHLREAGELSSDEFRRRWGAYMRGED